MADKASELGLASVGVRVKVDDRYASPSLGARDAGDVRPCDRVVASEDDGNRACLSRDPHRLLQCIDRHAGFDAGHLDVPCVHNTQVTQRIDPQRQVGTRGIVGVVVGGADRVRSETSTGSIRRACVVRRPDDHHVGAGKSRGFVKVAPLDAEEGHIGAVHASDAWGQRADSRASRRLRQLRTVAKLIASRPPARNMKVPITFTCGGTPNLVAP